MTRTIIAPSTLFWAFMLDSQHPYRIAVALANGLSTFQKSYSMGSKAALVGEGGCDFSQAVPAEDIQMSRWRRH
jgi:hypothetical protein